MNEYLLPESQPRGTEREFDVARNELKLYCLRQKVKWTAELEWLAEEAIEKTAKDFLRYWDVEQKLPSERRLRTKLEAARIGGSYLCGSLSRESFATRALLADTFASNDELERYVELTNALGDRINAALSEAYLFRDPDFSAAKVRLTEWAMQILEGATGKRPGLCKFDYKNEGGPLQRFSKALFTYATGLRPGSLDRAVETLRTVYTKG